MVSYTPKTRKHYLKSKRPANQKKHWILKLLSWWLQPFFKLSWQILLRLFLIPIYRLLKFGQRNQEKLFRTTDNKVYFLMVNKYVYHLVMIGITLVMVTQNFKIQTIRAQEYGHNSLINKVVRTDETYNYTEIIEEEITFKPFTKPKQPILTYRQSTGAVGLTKQKPQTEETVEFSPNLSQGGSAIIKPSISATHNKPKPRAEIENYLVKAGDTIFQIAEKFNISLNTILWANNLSARNIIRPGQELVIMPVSGVSHTINQGENLSFIAQQYDVKIATITNFNNLTSKKTLKVGQKIIIPGGKPITKRRARRKKNIATTRVNKVVGKGLFWPTTCRRITQYFKGYRHTGIDIGCGMSANLYAAEDGIVERSQWNRGYGYNIVIRHPDNKKTLYAHNKKGSLFVKKGERVAKGQKIALMGSTGNSTGPHLHFEVIVGGRRVNPFNYFK